jgi:hypothetical protein
VTATALDHIHDNTPTTVGGYITSEHVPANPLAAALARLTTAAQRVAGQPTTAVRTSDLRTLLDAYADAHQSAMVASGQSAETWEQVVARRFGGVAAA